MKQTELNSKLQDIENRSEISEQDLLLTQLNESLNMLEQSERARKDWQNLAEDLQKQLESYLNSDQGKLQIKVKNLSQDKESLRREEWLTMIKLKFLQQRCDSFEKIAIENRKGFLKEENDEQIFSD